jgi:hypothetical protein
MVKAGIFSICNLRSEICNQGEMSCQSTSIDAENVKKLLKDSRRWGRGEIGSCAPFVERRNLKRSFPLSALPRGRNHPLLVALQEGQQDLLEAK